MFREILREKQANNATVDKKHYQRTSEIKRKTATNNVSN